jgi:eukaryotic-like serine/threonine-protein kinase
MKHVREDLPDIQVVRPEVSATLAAVLDHMTEKDLDRRYADVDALVGDLEEALAIETARSGSSTGEATAVLRTIPAHARRRLPLRVRFPVPVIAFIAVLVVGGVLLALLLKGAADRTHPGTGRGTIKAPAGLTVVSLSRSAAHDYDPQSTDKEEHHDQAHLAVDRDDGTIWSTESYEGGQITKPLANGAPPGVGIYVDAKPKVDATRMQIQTPTPGWRATIYGAGPGKVPESIDGWTRIGGGIVARKNQRFTLNGDTAYRYYLVWITRLPEGESKAEISEIALLAPKRT